MDRIWRSQYQQGVPYEIDPNKYSSLVDLFERSFRDFANHTAYVNFGHEISYAELDEKSKQFACFLQSLGLKKGARVALMMPNILQYPIAIFGILRAGYAVVNTNPLYTADELQHQLNDSGAEAILILANVAKTLETIMPLPHLKHVIVTEIGDAMPGCKGMLMNIVVKYIKRLVPAFHIFNAISYKRALKIGAKRDFEPVSLNHQDIAFLQYTGGTTGISKGAILSHGNLVANVLQAYEWIKPLDVGSHDIIVTALPMYHIFSLTANCLVFLKAGAKNILITNPRDMKGFIDSIKDSKFTAFTGVNTLFNAMLHHPDFNTIDFSKLKLALAGGMALQKSVAMKWHELTKSPILEAYGLSETSPAVTMNPMYLKDANGSIGLPISSTDISLRGDNDEELGIGETGELCIKGPQVTSGYWQRPDETALVFTKDGYLKTGDIAQIDDKGFVYLVDRKKDIIVVSGFKVYPNEIEQVIAMMPQVREVGVVGVPSEQTGDAVKACIVKNETALTAEEVIAHCRKHLTAYKLPKIVEFYSELPKTNVGKILRRALK